MEKAKSFLRQILSLPYVNRELMSPKWSEFDIKKDKKDSINNLSIMEVMF